MTHVEWSRNGGTFYASSVLLRLCHVPSRVGALVLKRYCTSRVEVGSAGCSCSRARGILKARRRAPPLAIPRTRAALLPAAAIPISTAFFATNGQYHPPPPRNWLLCDTSLIPTQGYESIAAQVEDPCAEVEVEAELEPPFAADRKENDLGDVKVAACTTNDKRYLA